MRSSEAVLQAVRQRVRARVARRSKRTLPRMRAPSHARYMGDLLEIARDAQRTIAAELEPIFAEIALRQDSAEDENAAKKLRAALQRVRVQFERPTHGARFTAGRMVREIEKENRSAMNAQFKELVGIDVFGENPALASTLQRATTRNVALIESIPTKLLDDVESTIAPAVERGTRVEVLRDQLAERFGVSDSRAALIARDQVGKLNGELVGQRQQSLGVRTYTWSTSKDERVRGRPGGPKTTSDHFHLEGTVQSWDEPPVVDSADVRRAHPGEDFQCRCQALPRVDDLLDALGVSEDELPLPEPVAEPRPVARRRAPRARAPHPVVPPAAPARSSLEERLRAYDAERTREAAARAAPVAPLATPVKRSDIAGTLGPLATKVFGRRLTDLELDNLLGLDQILPDGITAEISTIREEFGLVRVHSAFKKDGQFAGNLVREFSKNKKGETVAHHALLTLEKQFQGSKIGAKVFNAQIEAYKRTGLVQQVKTEAAWVGQYAWTKAGFEWTDPKRVRKLMVDLRERLLTKVSEEEADAIMSQIRTPQDVAGLRVNDERVGKDLLVNYSDDLIEMRQTPGKLRPL